MLCKRCRGWKKCNQLHIDKTTNSTMVRGLWDYGTRGYVSGGLHWIRALIRGWIPGPKAGFEPGGGLLGGVGTHTPSLMTFSWTPSGSVRTLV